MQEWKSGRTPTAEQFLQDGPADDHGVLLQELLRLEMRFRLQRGEHLAAEEFLRRFPGRQELIRSLLAALASPEHESPSTLARVRQADSAVPGLPQPAAARQERPKASWPQVPGYQIEAELGKGGMGVVYKAQQQQLVRTVALKMIRAGAAADDAELTSFRTEARAVAKLRHAHNVQMYEVGEHDGLSPLPQSEPVLSTP